MLGMETQQFTLAASQADYLEIDLKTNAQFSFLLLFAGHSSTAFAGHSLVAISGYLNINVLDAINISVVNAAGTFSTDVVYALTAKGSANKIRVSMTEGQAREQTMTVMITGGSSNASISDFTAEVVLT